MSLPDDIARQLIDAAKDARAFAYAPYSGFPVGAALLAADGTVYTGCNVENSSFGLTCCAERTALFSAVAAGERNFLAVAVVADGRLVPPCGACRQALSEFAPDLPVVLASLSGQHTILSLTNLLPEPFSAEFLSRDTEHTRD